MKTIESIHLGATHAGRRCGLLMSALGLAQVLLLQTRIGAAAVTLTALHSFEPTEGQGVSGLVQGRDGNFYGTAVGGGSGAVWNAGCGTIFRIAPNGTFTNLYSFSGTDGQFPAGAGGPNTTGAGPGLVLGGDGNFYGITSAGGIGFRPSDPNGQPCYSQGPTGNGTIFRMTPDGTLTTLVFFDGTNGSSPSSILQGDDGNFYGTTSGILFGDLPAHWGTVFQMTPDGTLTTLAFFNGTNGSGPRSLIQERDGNFYGTTDGGGAYRHGTVFKMTLDGTLTTVVSLADTNASGPYSLMQASDGNFYGTMFLGGKLSVYTVNGGTYRDYLGTIFRVSPTGTLTNLVQFNWNNGALPVAALVEGTDGNLYGSTWSGGLGGTDGTTIGTLFKMTPQGKATTLLKFNGVNGLQPAASLVQASDGSFYGTASLGGTNDTQGIGIGSGVVFRLSVPGADTPKIINSSRSGNDFSVTWLSLVGRSYQLQVSSDLAGTNWSNAGAVIIATNRSSTTLDTLASRPQGFYRVVLLP